MWDLIVSVPDHCLSFYFLYQRVAGKTEITEITTEITMGITEITIVGSSRGRYDMVG